MSELPQSSQQRAFQCPECKGRIVIPANLPATAGPCPHCQATITSPEPDIYTSIIDVDLPPVVESMPAPAPAPIPEIVEPPISTAAHDTEHEEKHIAPAESEETAKSKKSTKRGSPVAVILILILVLGGLGGGAYYFMDKLKPKAEPITLTLPNKPKPSANPTLINYLAAPSLEEKLKYVLNAEELRPKMEAFYKEAMIDETDTTASAFSFIALPEMDTKKGFMLYAYDQPSTAPDSQGESTKILAFLKETATGVKLDWDIFAQTKYRTFNQFIKTPVIGKSETFRVIVSKDSTTNTAGFLVSDPAHQTDSVQITPDPESPARQELENLLLDSVRNSGPAKNTATIELTWTGDENAPQLEIKRFICWEFLGIGGKEIAEIPPSN